MSLDIFENPGPTPIQFIDKFHGNINLYIKREDLIHPFISGNKWRKLKYNIIEAHRQGHRRILTFGGAFSNHIYATAAAGAACGLDTIGVIRGEIKEPLNATLKDAGSWGMTLFPISRQDYKHKTNPEILSFLESEFGKFYLIPEGGSNFLALKGCAEIAMISEKFDYWCLSCGTGGTLAGLVSALNQQEKVLGFSALKGGRFLQEDIKKLLSEAGITNTATWGLVHDYHFGGYAKLSDSLLAFISDFKIKYDILLDPIYTAKMLFGVVDMIEKGLFAANSNILALHTGGLQGIAGIEEKYGLEIN